MSLKLLFDQNLSHRLCRALADVFPETAHVSRAGLDRADDDAIWKFARREGYAIVTMDADFPEIAALRGAPPKIIWLRCGNQPNNVVERILRDRAGLIQTFESDEDAACLELY